MLLSNDLPTCLWPDVRHEVLSSRRGPIRDLMVGFYDAWDRDGKSWLDAP
jgi:hypothetical protein